MLICSTTGTKARVPGLTVFLNVKKALITLKTRVFQSELFTNRLVEMKLVDLVSSNPKFIKLYVQTY